MSAQRAVRPALLLTLLLAFGLRIALLGNQELRGDEAFGYFFSLQSPAQIVDATLELGEPHPVASYMAQHFWLLLAGDSEFAMRFLSVWCGVLAVALIYRLGRLLGFAPWGAWLAALLLALSPYAVWHSQDARMYSMSLALTLAVVYLALEAVQRRRWQWSAGYVAVAWLALHTHYYAFFVLAGLTIFFVGRALMTPGARPTLMAWVWWNLLLALLYLPWLADASGVLADYRGNGDSPGLLEMLRRAVSVFAVGESTPADQQILWALLAGLLLALGMMRLAFGGPVKRRALWLLSCYLFAPLFLTWWGARARPIFDERYLIAASPAFYLLLAAAASPHVGRRPTRWDAWLQGAAIAGLVVLSAAAFISLARYVVDPAYSKTRGWRELAVVINRFSLGLSPEQVRIAQNFPDPTLWYYQRGEVEHLALPPAPHDGAGSRRAVEELAAANVQRVILPVQPADNWDDSGLAAAALAEKYDLVVAEQVGVWPLQVYAGSPRLDASQPLSYTFANGVKLVGVSGLDDASPTPGGPLIATLFWRAPVETIGNLKATLQLLGPDGSLAAQQDRPLAEARAVDGATLSKSYGFILPPTLSPGRYTLIIALYDPDQPGSPRVPTSAGVDVVVLAEFGVNE